MTITLIAAIYFFIAVLTAEWVNGQLKPAKPSGGVWCISLFCGLLWPVYWFVYAIKVKQ